MTETLRGVPDASGLASGAQPGVVLPATPAAGPATPPTPAQATGREDSLAWVLAILPLAAMALRAMAGALEINLGVVSLTSLAGAAALVVADKRAMAGQGRLRHSALPSTAWFLIAPVYLFKRATVLRAPKTQFWVSLACMALAFAGETASAARAALDARNAGSAETTTNAVPALPGCADKAYMPSVVNVFGDIAEVRNAGIRGVVVTRRIDRGVGQDEVPPVRVCSGTMAASDGQDYQITYGFEIIQDQVIVNVELQ